MARTSTAAPPAKRRRGRPPKPGGPKPQAEVQRAYRARLAAAGKVVRLVDANAASPVPAALADFDPVRDGIYERAWVANMQDDLRRAIIQAGRLEKDRDRWKKDYDRAEAQLRRLEEWRSDDWKEKTALQNEVAALKRQLADRRGQQ
jgi:hypothetical protein